MREVFARLDDTLFKRMFQPVANLLTHRFGFSCTSAACFCIDVASICWIASRVPELSLSVNMWDGPTAMLNLALLLLGLIAMISLRILFRRAGARTGVKLANPLRSAMQPHRAIILVMLAARLTRLQGPGLASLADLAMLSCSAAALYLGACAECPPVRRHCPALASVA